jgi:uncharacterized protein YaaW (UPF0174 family)
MLLAVQIRIAAQAHKPRELFEPVDAPNYIVRLLVADYLAGQMVELLLCHGVALSMETIANIYDVSIPACAAIAAVSAT